jgi:hypothetical protein
MPCVLELDHFRQRDVYRQVAELSLPPCLNEGPRVLAHDCRSIERVRRSPGYYVVAQMLKIEFAGVRMLGANLFVEIPAVL